MTAEFVFVFLLFCFVYGRGATSDAERRIGRLLVKPVLNWANVCSPNILRTFRRTMIRFLIEL